MFTEDTFRKLPRESLERLEHQWTATARHKRTLEKVARDALQIDEAEGFHKAASFVEGEIELVRKISAEKNKS